MHNSALNTDSSETAQFDESYLNYQLQRSGFRKLIRKLYLWNLRRHCLGPTLDFGCGVGELLSILPAGSLGAEVNAASVRFCRARGLNVRLYEPESDRYELRDFEGLGLATLVMAHVLEHLSDSAQVLRTLLNSCARLGIKRAVFVVPGVKGFRHDKTHRTFVCEEFIDANSLRRIGPWRMIHLSHFPVNAAWFGKFFTHNELIFIYEQQP